MKTSIILLIAIFLNTAFLLSEPISILFKDLNSWVLLAIEAILIGVHLINKTVKELREECEPDLGDLDLFVYKSHKKNEIMNST